MMTRLIKKQGILASLLCLGILLAADGAGTVQASAIRADILQASDRKQSGEYVRRRFLDRMNKPFNSRDQRRKLLIIGDSHAQDLYNALAENNIQQHYQVSTRRVPAICGLYLGPENITPLINKKHVSICQKADTLKTALPQIRQADVIIIAANWKLWSAQRLATTVQNLAIQAPQQLFVVGRKDFGKLNLRQYLRLPESKLRQLHNPVYATQHTINQTMQRSLPANVFVNIQGLICRSERDCPLFTPQTRLISFDGGHLTQQGARYVGQVLLRSPPLNRLLR